MKKLFILVCCSLIFLTGCGNTSYFQSADNSLDDQADSFDNPNKDETAKEETEPVSETIFVQVAGAVNRPGVYELPFDSRVFVAIDEAGGLLQTADDSDLNLAELLSDGQKIYVYTKVERQEAKELELTQSRTADGLTNINTASLSELCKLPGIGESKANLIITYREENGDFENIEDIKKVSGIGDGIYNQIYSLIKTN